MNLIKGDLAAKENVNIIKQLKYINMVKECNFQITHDNRNFDNYYNDIKISL